MHALPAEIGLSGISGISGRERGVPEMPGPHGWGQAHQRRAQQQGGEPLREPVPRAGTVIPFRDPARNVVR
jgi:hypothetical protein